MKKYIYIALAVIFLGISGFGVAINSLYTAQKKENYVLKKQLTEMNVSYINLAKSYDELSKQKTYSISLAPNITNKVNSNFGSLKEVTFQYYFRMDNKALLLEPDSTYVIKKR